MKEAINCVFTSSASYFEGADFQNVTIKICDLSLKVKKTEFPFSALQYFVVI